MTCSTSAAVRAARLSAIARSAYLDVVASEVVDALRMSGLRTILLRGPAIGRWLYEDAQMRTYNDVDLLVEARSEQQGEAVLERLGFVDVSVAGVLGGDRPTHARTWKREQDAAFIDIHTTILGARAEPAVIWGELSTETDRLDVGRLEMEVPSLTARTVIVALHAAHHGGQVRPPLVDLERALSIAPEAVWARAVRLAARVDAVPAFSAGLRLVPEGALLADRLSLPKGVPVDVMLRASTPPPMALGFDWLARQRGVRAKSALVVTKVVPPRHFMRSWTPIARRGRFGLAIAYIWRLLWLVGHAGPGYRAWRRARRAA